MPFDASKRESHLMVAEQPDLEWVVDTILVRLDEQDKILKDAIGDLKSTVNRLQKNVLDLEERRHQDMTAVYNVLRQYVLTVRFTTSSFC